VGTAVAIAVADRIGYPVLLKPSAGGGGKGMRIVYHEDQMESALSASIQETKKAFGDDIEILKEIVQGDTLQIIGNVREWNSELYILPEVVKKVDPRWLLVRKLEIQNMKKDLPVSEKGDSGLKSSILEKIKGAEADGGIDVDAIIMDVEASPDAINGEVKKLLEEGLVYEPRPGRLRPARGSL